MLDLDHKSLYFDQKVIKFVCKKNDPKPRIPVMQTSKSPHTSSKGLYAQALMV